MTNKEAKEIIDTIPLLDYNGEVKPDWIIAIDMAIKALEQEPKTGRWITWKEAGNEIPSETRFECSVCHDCAQTLYNGLDLLSPYCPNCGAKMEWEEL